MDQLSGIARPVCASGRGARGRAWGERALAAMSDISTDIDGNGGAPVYQVLARKYRPQTFEEMIGQETMVRTLSNAMARERIAHAFVLTGVRGVGKTSTARVIARALNCVGPDGTGGPTIAPCGVCEPCVAIAESRHVDVLEMDAASNTGVDNIRELLDGVRYLPVSARNKIYIIDEVHMLSRNAFNALLKTLEEPPPRVIFIFATTEVRKIPITVLSRCQRFDLRRVEADVLARHLAAIAEKEGAEIEAEALALLAQAGDGSVRDALSLLDQAIAHGQGAVTAEQTRDMLGLADRGRVFDLFEILMRGDIAGALVALRTQYDLGVDPLVVLQDLLELSHLLTRLKVVPGAESEPGAAELERTRGREIADGISMPVLARTWQMLLKGIGEVRQAPIAISATEMVLVRIAYGAQLPTPGELARQLADGAPTTVPAATPSAPPPTGGATTSALPAVAPTPQARSMPAGEAARAPEPVAAPETAPEPAPGDEVESYEALVALATQRREGTLAAWLHNNVRLVSFQPGHLVLQPAGDVGGDLTSGLRDRLRALTGRDWRVELAPEAEAQPTLAERADAAQASRVAEAADHPAVRAVLDTFPGARITAVRDIGAAPAPDDMDPTREEDTSSA